MLRKFIQDLSIAIKKATKASKPKLHEPDLNYLDSNQINKCIKKNFVSTAGPQVKEFELKLASYTKSKYVVATNSGTSALHLALKLLKVDSNCEILLPSLNFVASANAIKYCSATPHFVDSNEQTLSVDSRKLFYYLKNISVIKNNQCYNKKTKKKIKALILVHLYGSCGDILEIKKICKLFKIKLVEDAAEAIGSFYKKKHLGTYGEIGILSFNGNKTITTGSGGALLINNKKIAKKAYNLSTVSKVIHKWRLEYDGVGYNYRMPSLNASLGISQLRRLKKILNEKKNLFYRYKKMLNKFIEFKLLEEHQNAKSNFWLNTIILKFDSLSKRDQIIEGLIKKGVQVRPSWKLLHKLQHFKKCPKMNLVNAIKLEKNIINLPSSSKYGKD